MSETRAGGACIGAPSLVAVDEEQQTVSVTAALRKYDVVTARQSVRRVGIHRIEEVIALKSAGDDGAQEPLASTRCEPSEA
jgi:hypothetical protein